MDGLRVTGSMMDFCVNTKITKKSYLPVTGCCTVHLHSNGFLANTFRPLYAVDLSKINKTLHVPDIVWPGCTFLTVCVVFIVSVTCGDAGGGTTGDGYFRSVNGSSRNSIDELIETIGLYCSSCDSQSY